MDRDISRESLVRHNIHYEANVYRANHANTKSPTHALPDHVKAVRDGLLCMEKILPEDCDATLREELAKHGSVNVGPDWCLHPEKSAFTRGKHHERMLQQSSFHDNLRFCEQVAERAKEILEDSEDEWTFFWRSRIFELFDDEARTHPGFMGEELTSSHRYENVLWNEFDKFIKPNPPGVPCRTQPKPDLTYAFPIQTSAPESLEGFARDELTQAFSLQSLEKLVGRGVTCAPTSALRKAINLPDRAKWSSSDRSCFPWAVVEMKKDVSASDDGAVERCYCQAANAAAAALDLQGQLFDKTDDNYSLRPPPVVAFTCVGPVVKVWLAYQDKSRIFGPTIQRMVCIWSTSVRLTWGVASLRAIIRNMHTWSSRLLKPRLQVAISQASRGINKPFDFFRPSSQCLPIPTVHCLEAVHTNSSSTPPSTSSRLTPITSEVVGKPTTPERHNTPAPHTRIDTPTPLRSTENTSRNSQAKVVSDSRNNPIFGTENNASSDRNPARIPGLFERATDSGTGIFSRSGFISSTSTTAGFGLRSQSVAKMGGLFGGTIIDVARESGQYTRGSSTSNGATRGNLFGSSDPSIHYIDNPQDSNQSSTSNLPSKLATTFCGGDGSINNSTACVSSPKPAFGRSWKPTFGTHDSINTSLTPGPSSGPTFIWPPKPAIRSTCKPNSGGLGTSSNRNGGELFGVAKPSGLTALINIGGSTSSVPAKKTNVCDITTVLESTSLEDVPVDDTNPGTAGTLFSGYRQPREQWGQDDFQTITSQSPHKNYSLEELRVADYNRGRRYRLPSNELDLRIDSCKAQGDYTDDDSDNISDDESNNDSDDNFDEDSDEDLDSDSSPSSTNNDFSDDSS